MHCVQCPLDTSNTSALPRDQKCLQTLPDVPWGQNSPWLRTTALYYRITSHIDKTPALASVWSSTLDTAEETSPGHHLLWHEGNRAPPKSCHRGDEQCRGERRSVTSSPLLSNSTNPTSSQTRPTSGPRPRPASDQQSVSQPTCRHCTSQVVWSVRYTVMYHVLGSAELPGGRNRHLTPPDLVQPTIPALPLPSLNNLDMKVS